MSKEAQNGARQAFRAYSKRLRKVTRYHTTASGVAACGTRAMWQRVVEVRRAADGHAFYSGVMLCGSVWECPVCAHVIQGGRAEELRRFGVAHRGKGGELYLATFTLPHTYGDALRASRQLVAQSWQGVQRGRAWVAAKDQAGVVATVRALEITEGPHGWHPHLHVLLATRAPLSEDQEAALLAFLRDRWEAEVARRGWRLPSRRHGVTLVRAERETYVAKMVNELVRGARKRGRSAPDGEQRRTPWEILGDVADFQRPADVARWKEYAGEMRGARQLTWGGELRTLAARAAYGLEEQTDLELAAAEERQPAETVWTFGTKSWAMVARRPRLEAAILDLVEAHADPWEAADAVVKLCAAALRREPVPF